jgi:uncharacterized protein
MTDIYDAALDDLDRLVSDTWHELDAKNARRIKDATTTLRAERDALRTKEKLWKAAYEDAIKLLNGSKSPGEIERPFILLGEKGETR